MFKIYIREAKDGDYHFILERREPAYYCYHRSWRASLEEVWQVISDEMNKKKKL